MSVTWRHKAESWSMSRTWWWVLFGVVPLLSGLTSLWFGQDITWDLRNYHYYNPYAFLHDRMGYDIAPAQLQSFFSPYLDIPFYLLMASFPAWVVSFTLGALHGINFSIVFAITWRVVQGLVAYKRALLGLFCAGLGCFAPGFLLELGNTNHDNTLSVLVLTAVLLLVIALQHVDAPNKRRAYLLVGLAGVVMGAAVGLKLTNLIFALGSAVGLFFMVPTWRGRFNVLLIYGCFGLATSLLIAGPWWWLMWERFGNPLLPFYNHIFESPAVAPVKHVRTSKLPTNWLEYLGWPLVFSDDVTRVGTGNRFRDVRFGVVWIIALVYLITALIRMIVGAAKRPEAGRRWFEDRAGTFLLVLFGAAFVVWMVRFSVYRYIIPLELLVPLVLFILIEKLGLPRRYQLGYGLIAVVLILALFRPSVPRFRSPDWSKPYFQVDTSFLSNPDSTSVVILGGSPLSFVIPEFPPAVRFLRPEGNLHLRDDDGFMKEIKTTIAEHGGPLYVMYFGRERRIRLEKSANRYHINIDSTRCFPLKTNIPGQIKMCPATRR